MPLTNQPHPEERPEGARLEGPTTALQASSRLLASTSAFAGVTNRILGRLEPADAIRRAIALLVRGDHEEAEELCRAILAAAPDHSEALHLLGVIRNRQGKHLEATALITTALERNPSSAEAHADLGSVLQALNRHEEAAASYRAALALKPDLAAAHNNLGAALATLGRPAEAEACYRSAIALAPGYVEAHANLGMALRQEGRIGEAIACHRRVVELRPESAYAHWHLGNSLAAAGRIEEGVAVTRRALALDPGHALAHTNLIFALNFDARLGLAELQAERRRWQDQHAQRFAAAIRQHPNALEPERRLRIGYVSAHFNRQTASYAFGGVLLEHDPEQVELVCYSDTAREDEFTRRFRARARLWRSILGRPDDEVAELIRADGIDILVDLVGHMDGHRLLVFARKPAPIQITAWGEPTGTGLATMDYLLADPVLVPPGARHLLSERVFDLPCFLGYWVPDARPEPGPLPALARGEFTFGSFNRLAKLTPATLKGWAQILRRVPAARLLLKAVELGDAEEQARVRATLAQDGVAGERVAFLGRTARSAHFAAYQTLDLALDPFPHGGGMTTLDALWMGVPVVSWAGATISSRLAAASLTALGLADFVAPDREAYVELAVAKAGDLGALARLRATLRARLAKSEFGDPARYARAVETAYRAMWRRWCESHVARLV